MGLIYVRHSTRNELEPKAKGPLPGEDWMVGELCPGCGEPFRAGDMTTLVVIGPGDDPEAREKHLGGRYYNAAAVAAHYACVTGREGEADV